jgi:hypothetical protein
MDAAAASPANKPTRSSAGAVCQALSAHSPNPTPMATQTAADNPIPRNATAPGNGLGAGEAGSSTGGCASVTDPGAHN